MSYGFNSLLEGRRFVKVLSKWKLRNAIDSSILCIAANTEEALEVLRPTRKEERIVRGGSVHQNRAREYESNEWVHTLPLGPCRCIDSL